MIMECQVVCVFYCSWGGSPVEGKGSPEPKIWTLSSGHLSIPGISVLISRWQGNPDLREGNCPKFISGGWHSQWPFLGHVHEGNRGLGHLLLESMRWCVQRGLYKVAQQGCVDCHCQHSLSQRYIHVFLHYLPTSCLFFPMTQSHSFLKVITIPKWTHKSKFLH